MKELKRGREMNMKIRRWVWLSLWVLSLAAISCYGGAVSYGLFGGITLIPVVSLIYLIVVYFHLKILQQVEGRSMVCGQPVPYFFVLQNEDKWIFAGVSVTLFSSFSYVEELPGDTEYELLPGDKYTFETKLTCRYRGEYEVGVKELVMTDFFRLFKIRYRIPETIRVVVRPRVVHVTGLNSVDDFLVQAQRESSREPVQPDLVVRDYIRGDALKQIHWKATAREQKLKVRNMTGEERQGIALLWDTKRLSLDAKEYLPVENKILETVLALGNFLAERNISFSACYHQKGMREEHVEGYRNFDEFYKIVSEVSFDRDEKFTEILFEAEKCGIISGSRLLFCVLSELNDEIIKLTEEFGRTGTLLVLYVITDESMESYLKQSNERRRIMTIPVESGLEGRL